MAKTGRPRTFDRDEAVDQALHLFWQHGYESTSLSQLKAGIGGGISAPSFYAAFGSKEALFHEAVQRYLTVYGRLLESLWDDDMPAREAIALALRRSARMQSERGHPRGCMVSLGIMTAPSPEHAGIAKPLADERARVRTGFQRCIERGIATGELAADTDAQALAMVFDGFLHGLSTLTRDRVRAATIDAAITQIMRALDSAGGSGS